MNKFFTYKFDKWYSKEKPALVFNFGKYKDDTVYLTTIIGEGRKYITWCINNIKGFEDEFKQHEYEYNFYLDQKRLGNEVAKVSAEFDKMINKTYHNKNTHDPFDYDYDSGVPEWECGAF